MKERILVDLKTAMKEQDKLKLPVIRMVKGAIVMEELDKKRPLTDDEVIAIIAKNIKTRKESIVEFEKASRNDLVEATLKEVAILKTYMPEELSEEEVLKIIDEAFLTINPTSNKDMGKIMAYITPLLRGKADMQIVSGIVKSKVSNL